MYYQIKKRLQHIYSSSS